MRHVYHSNIVKYTIGLRTSSPIGNSVDHPHEDGRQDIRAVELEFLRSTKCAREWMNETVGSWRRGVLGLRVNTETAGSWLRRGCGGVVLVRQSSAAPDRYFE